MPLIEGIDGDEPKIKQREKNADCHTTIYENIFMLAQDYGMFSVVVAAGSIIIAFLANQPIKQEKTVYAISKQSR